MLDFGCLSKLLQKLFWLKNILSLWSWVDGADLMEVDAVVYQLHMGFLLTLTT